MEDLSGPEHRFLGILRWRPASDSQVELKIAWQGRDGAQPALAWMSEWDVQERWPFALYDFWNLLGGRDFETELVEYHPYKLLSYNRSKRTFRTQWVGYSANECSDEPAWKIRKEHKAGRLITEYWRMRRNMA